MFDPAYGIYPPYIHNDFIAIDINYVEKKIRPEIVQVDWKAIGGRIRKLRGLEMTQTDVAVCSEAEIGAAVLLSIAGEFNTSLEWLPSGGQKNY